MLVRSVTAHAFGPLVGETLRFADGMTVVHGVNESAKSSWHAAIYAALCGRRRGRAPSAPERRFAELHRPWDRDDWVVSAEVLLDDGRRLEVRQDLAGRVDCDVRDLDLGRDCSDEFIKDGTPDLARWLGLDRHSFLATACVAQAQVLAVHDRAGGLQEQLQRAAATAGADQTAAAALSHIEAYRREQVGSDRAPRRPLRVAAAAVTQAQAALTQARSAHLAYQESLVEGDRLRAAAAVAERALRRHEATLAARAAAQEADALGQRVAEVDALVATVGKAEPASAVDDEDTAVRVTAALSAWDSRPAAPPDDDRGAEAHTDRPVGGPGDTVAGEPGGGPDGDSVPRLTDQEPWDLGPVVPLGGPDDDPGSGPDSGSGGDEAAGLTDQELWDLARDLELVAPPVDPVIDDRVVAARTRWAEATRARQRGRRLLLGASAFAVAAAVVLVAGIAWVDLMVPGAAVAGALAVVAAMLGLLSRNASPADDVGAIQREMDAALLDAAAALRAEQSALAHRDGARSRAGRLGLPPTADGIRELARTRAGSTMVADRDEQWQRQITAASQQWQRQISETRRDAQREIAQTRSLAEREISEHRLEVLRQVTAARRQINQARQRAAEQVAAAARLCAIATDDLDDLDDLDDTAEALRTWQRRRADRNVTLDTARRGWTRLQSLIGVGTAAGTDEVRDAVADLRQKATLARQVAVRTAAHALEFGAAPVRGDGTAVRVEPRGGVAGAADGDSAALRGLREQVQEANARADLAQGARLAIERGLAPVGEAEEELARTEAELSRLLGLDQTLELTRAFLAAAQERAHRTIAPVLVDTVGRWLPAATAGRYSAVIVDPEKLRVQVRGPAGRWRDAELLSHGTAEQVYLLLRIALAQHLARPTTVCPLLLDDVTVHADTRRTEAILELLLAAAQERQIILFTQQDQVRDWARTHLSGPNHTTHSLAELASV